MEIEEVSSIEYGQILKEPYHVFGNVAFNEFNKGKCEKVHYLLFKEGKYRLGIIGGVSEGRFNSPFSAPFNGFSYLSPDIRLIHIEGALDSLNDWSRLKGFSEIRIVLPPCIYNRNFNSKILNCMARAEYKIETYDLNYSFNLEKFNENYEREIWRNARKNLKTSRKHGLEFIKCSSIDEKKVAYDVISTNRSSKGFPLRMTWNQVFSTIQHIDADFFQIKNRNNPIAAAMVFQVAKSIVQVIYWGDLPEYSNFRTMNLLSLKVFEYYKEKDVKIVDLGPSTEHSLPNYGLAEFKESIGCDIDMKYTLTRKIG